MAGDSDLRKPFCPLSLSWSGRPDLNRRPLAPQASALPGCATARQTKISGLYRTRTCGLWFRRPTLYPSELIAHCYFFLCLSLRRLFLRLWVAILWRFLFLPLGKQSPPSAPRSYRSFNWFFSTCALNSREGLNTGTGRDGIPTVSPVFGFLPVRGALRTTLNVPKPRISICWLSLNATATVDRNPSTTAPVSVFVSPVAPAILSIMSALVTASPSSSEFLERIPHRDALGKERKHAGLQPVHNRLPPAGPALFDGLRLPP